MPAIYQDLHQAVGIGFLKSVLWGGYYPYFTDGGTE